MTNISNGEDTRAQAMLDHAMAAFETAQEVLRRAVEKLMAEEKVSGTDLTKDLREMNHALLMALSFEEKTRGAAGQGQAGAGSLDLEAARAEVGLRLDCLRATRDG